MTYRKFDSSKEAHKFRSVWGGVLARDLKDQFHWFPGSWSALKIIKAPQLKGLGAIIC